MKTLAVLALILSPSFSHAACPQIDGDYHLTQKPITNIRDLLPNETVSGWYFLGDADLTLSYPAPGPNTDVVFTQQLSNGVDTLNLGRSYVTYILDNQAHVWDADKNADNYFRQYKAYCTGNFIIIDEDGSNNDTKKKRVDTYHAQTVLRVEGNGKLSFQRRGQMMNLQNSVVIDGVEHMELMK